MNKFDDCKTNEDLIQAYIKEAVKTANKEAIEDSDRYFRSYIFGEFGEIIGMVKKEHYHKMNISKELYVDEIGDLFWGFAFNKIFGHSSINWDIEDIAEEYGSNCNLQAILDFSVDYDINKVILGIIGLMEYKEITVREVLEYNIKKLRKRYPNGYSHKACEERMDYNG